MVDVVEGVAVLEASKDHQLPDATLNVGVFIARNRMVNLVSKRRSLDEIKASRPLVDYETRYSVPEWTTSMFIDALYAELTRTAAANGVPAGSK